MATIQGLLKTLEKYRESPDSAGVSLRLNLAELLIEGMKRKGWNQRQLAEAAGVKESYLARLIHADENCTFRSAGNLLFALGMKAKLGEAEPATRGTGSMTLVTASDPNQGKDRIKNHQRSHRHRKM